MKATLSSAVLLASSLAAATEYWPPEWRRAAPARLAVELTLIGASAGIYVTPWCSNVDYTIPNPGARVDLLRLGIGVEVVERLDLVLGTTLKVANVEGFGGESFLPIGARLCWNFSPRRRWRRKTVSLFAAYHHSGSRDHGTNRQSFDIAPVEFGVDYGCTFYVLTPRVTLRAQTQNHDGVGMQLSLSVGLGLGGTYVFGHTEEEELEGEL